MVVHKRQDSTSSSSTLNNSEAGGGAGHHSDGFLREAIIALHRATTVNQEDIRTSGTRHLEYREHVKLHFFPLYTLEQT